MSNNKTYQFSVWNFSDKEIDQIVSIATEAMLGWNIRPIDKRRYTKNVLDYTVFYKLLETRSDGRMYHAGRYFHPEHDLPIEALWRICKPMIDAVSGFSITKSKDWNKLNISPGSSKYHNQSDIENQETILFKLSQYGYISFSVAGSVWEITQANKELQHV